MTMLELAPLGVLDLHLEGSARRGAVRRGGGSRRSWQRQRSQRDLGCLLRGLRLLLGHI